MFSYTTIRKKRRKELESREGAFFDLRFLQAMPREYLSECLDALPKSKSQLRQDIFALVQTEFKTGGFFVEFGATNGLELNNSALLEAEFGWNGILAEPAKGWHDELRRNRNCTIETRCVWKTSGDVLQFTETPRGENSSISTFTNTRRKLRGHNFPVETISLNDLLERHNAPEQIDYMSVDTEGSEFDILQAFDFTRWHVGTFTIEHNFAPQREKIFQLMTSKGYRRVLEDISRFDDWYVKDGS